MRCTVGYVGGEYTKASSRNRAEFEQQQALQSKTAGGYARPEDLLGGSAVMRANAAAQLR